jgi:hypothetical protein
MQVTAALAPPLPFQTVIWNSYVVDQYITITSAFYSTQLRPHQWHPTHATILEVLVVSGMRDALLAASTVAKSSNILIQADEFIIIRKTPRPRRDRKRALDKLKNGVYDMQVPAATNAQQNTSNVDSNMLQFTSTLHDNFYHAPATTLHRIAKHYPETRPSSMHSKHFFMTAIKDVHTANKLEHHSPQ